METFYIDRQFGQAIFIDVEKGIVDKCYNESEKFNNRMNELYKGKPITFLKEDFEKRMKPIYHNVRSTKIVDSIRLIDAIKIKIKLINNMISDFATPKDMKGMLILKNDEHKLSLFSAETKLKEERLRVKTEHKF